LEGLPEQGDDGGLTGNHEVCNAIFIEVGRENGGRQRCVN